MRSARALEERLDMFSPRAENIPAQAFDRAWHAFLEHAEVYP